MKEEKKMAQGGEWGVEGGEVGVVDVVDVVQVQGLLFLFVLVLGAFFFFARQKWKNMSLWTLLFTHT